MFANTLVFFCTVLMVGCLYVLWQWQKAEERAALADRQAAIATKLSDGVLQDLALAREQSAKLDRERGNVVKMLGEAERLHANLRGEIGNWQQKHDDVLDASKQALAEKDKYEQTLATNLDTTKSLLNQTGQALSEEPSTAQQSLARAEQERLLVEKEANLLALQRNAADAQKRIAEKTTEELGQKAQLLNQENNRLDGDVTRMRGVINNLEILKNELNMRNVGLAGEINQLRATIRSLEDRIHTMEQQQDRDSKKKRANQ